MLLHHPSATSSLVGGLGIQPCDQLDLWPQSSCLFVAVVQVSFATTGFLPLYDDDDDDGDYGVYGGDCYDMIMM